MKRIHIFGASGAGTTTLGKALAKQLSIPFFDSDDYYWQKTDPPYRQSVPRLERIQNLLADLKDKESWVLSGSVLKWGDTLKPLFSLAVFITVPQATRLERLRKREVQRYGSRIEPGGDMYESSQAFQDWARSYDTAGLETRSLLGHQSWMQELTCPVIHLESSQAVEQLVNQVLLHLNSVIE